MAEEQKMPWEQEFVVRGAVPPIQEESTDGVLPWLRNLIFKGESQSPNQRDSGIRPITQVPTDFDSVFNRLLKQESGAKHMDEKGNLITSKAGARGITQLMPKTAKNPGYGIEGVKDESESEYLRVGKEYLQALHKKYGDYEKALAAYNAGPGSVDTAVGKAGRFGGDWKDYLPKKEETLPYIRNILGSNKK